MITTNDHELAERMRAMRNHGASISEEQRHYGAKPYLLPEFNLLGFNYRMTDLQGAVGLVQLSKLEGFIKARARSAAYYRERLGALAWLWLPEEPPSGRHGWQAFVVYVDPQGAPRPRDEIMETLQDKGISARPGTHAVHMLGLYRHRFGTSGDNFPVACECDCNTMAIPLHNRMSTRDYDYVINALRDL